MARRGGQRSLARDLLVFLVGAMAVAWLATALVSYFEARHELEELLDAHLTQMASLLLAEASQESRTVDDEHAPQLHRYGRRVSFQLWENGTRLRLHSVNAPDTRLSPREEGFSDVTVDGRGWRVFSAWDENRRYVVQVGERADARDEIVARIAANLLLPLLFALPALAVLIGLGIRRATQPLRVLSRQVEERTPANLAAVEVAEAPTEVAPLVDSLNRLFERVRITSENERRFTADAAHELRTPLAALRAQAQVARGSTDDAERRRALDNVIAGCDRASHLVAQLLTLARLEPQGFRAERAPCTLREVLQHTIIELAPMALNKSVELELHGDSSATVLGEARLLEILFRNLVDNAVRYGPAQSRVRIRIDRTGRDVVVRIADEGPGVPPVERESLGRRFHRLGGSDASGSGLGLSIARRIAELHDATIAFEETKQGAGLTVNVSFPAGH
jgi:two-component system sensor histidine kinase QseC